MKTCHWLAAAGCLLGILSLAGCVRASPAQETWDLKKMADQIDQTNVVVGVGGDGFCSGTIISKQHRLVLTASHCVTDRITREQQEFVDPVTGEVTKKTIEKKLDLEVWQNITRDYQVISSRHYVAKIVGNDAGNDVALLQIRCLLQGADGSSARPGKSRADARANNLCGRKSGRDSR